MADLFVVDVLDTIEMDNGYLVDIQLWSDSAVRESAPYWGSTAEPVDAAAFDASIPF